MMENIGKTNVFHFAQKSWKTLVKPMLVVLESPNLQVPEIMEFWKPLVKAVFPMTLVAKIMETLVEPRFSKVSLVSANMAE